MATVSRLLTRVRSCLARVADKASVLVGRGHVIAPTLLGDGPHDCAPASLYWAAPKLSELQISEAFQYCTTNWPYGGVTNTEFAIVLRHLGVSNQYCAETETLGDLLARTPARCIALVPYHFLAILNGRIVGKDAHRAWDANVTVYCSWSLG